MGIQSALDVSQKTLSDVDAIISTVPVSVSGIPCVTVSPTLSREDSELVANLLSVLPISRRILHGSRRAPTAGTLVLDRRAILFNSCAEDWVQAVTLAGNLLAELGYCEPRYVAAMVDKIQRFGGYVVLGDGVALPHSSPSDGVIRAGLSMVRLSQPVAFPGHASDPVWLVLGLAVTRDTSQEMIRSVNAFLTSPGFERLKKAKDDRSFKAALNSVVDVCDNSSAKE